MFDELWRDFRLVEALGAIGGRQLADGERDRAAVTLGSLERALLRELAGEERLLVEAERFIGSAELFCDLRRQADQLRALSERIRLHLDNHDHESAAEGLRLLRLALRVHQGEAAAVAYPILPQPSDRSKTSA
jgi:hypothetical protein